VLIAQFWVGAFPIGWREKTSRDLAESFFLRYMTVPILIVFYLGHKFYYRTKVVRLHEMDVDTGRREFNMSILLVQEAEEKAAWPAWKKAYKFFC
jgi:amino acid transporter